MNKMLLLLLTAGAAVNATAGNSRAAAPLATEGTRSLVKSGAGADPATAAVLATRPRAVFPETGVSRTLNYVLYRNNVFIPVSANGGKPCLFWVDTGGGTTFINSRHPDFTVLRDESARLHSVDSENAGKIEKDAAVFYDLDSLKFAGIELRHTVVQFLPSDFFDQTIHSEAGLEICGMLGTTALAGMVTELDYPRNIITFSTRAAVSPEARAAKIKIDPQKGNMTWVELAFKNGKKNGFVLDTGCSQAMKLTAASAAELGLALADGQYSVPEGSLGGQAVPPLRAAVSKVPFDLLGYGFFRDYRMTLDYPSGAVYFSR